MEGFLVCHGPLQSAISRHTSEWWRSRLDTNPSFGDISPYRYFLSDKTSLYVLDVDNGRACVNGEFTPVSSLTPEKLEILDLLAGACLAYWKMSSRIRCLRLPTVAYAVTVMFLDGLWRDLTFPLTHVMLDQDWQNKNDTTRIKRFRLIFPRNYVGAIENYVVQDECFKDHGASFTARTVQPAL